MSCRCLRALVLYMCADAGLERSITLTKLHLKCPLGTKVNAPSVDRLGDKRKVPFKKRAGARGVKHGCPVKATLSVQVVSCSPVDKSTSTTWLRLILRMPLEHRTHKPGTLGTIQAFNRPYPLAHASFVAQVVNSG